MEYGFLFLLLIANAAVVIWYVRRGHAENRWLSPLPVVLANYILHYPVRALAIVFFGYAEDYHFGTMEIGLALLYSTAFLVVTILVFNRTPIARSPEAGQSEVVEEELRGSGLYVSLLFILYMASFIYLVLAGSLFWLGAVEMTPMAKAAKLLLSIKWLLLGYFVVASRSRMSWMIRLQLLAVAATVIGSAIVSTAKGELVWLLVLVCLWASAKRRALPIGAIVAGVALIGTFSVYSYLVRYYGTVTGRSEFAIIQENIERALEQAGSVETVREKGIDSSIDRFSGIDGLTLCQRRGTFLEDNPYQWGSIIELLLVVPRALWRERPKVAFNMFVSQDVWGMPWYIESATPIGRIGESFYVLNWAGLIYAVFYGVLWKWLYGRLYLRAQSRLTQAYYIALLYCMIFPDDNLIPGPAAFLCVSGVTLVGLVLERLNQRASGQSTTPGRPILLSGGRL